MKRNQIKGFNFKLFSFYFEVVTIKKIPRVFAISKPRSKTIWRLEL